jgi:hypothetical protein
LQHPRSLPDCQSDARPVLSCPAIALRLVWPAAWNISNDRQNIGRKQCRLSHTGRTHALHRADWVRPPPRPPWYVPRSPHARVRQRPRGYEWSGM